MMSNDLIEFFNLTLEYKELEATTQAFNELQGFKQQITQQQGTDVDLQKLNAIDEQLGLMQSRITELAVKFDKEGIRSSLIQNILEQKQKTEQRPPLEILK
jgi:hypothetical protein